MFCDTRYLLYWIATKGLCFCVISSSIVRFLFQYAIGLGLRGCHSNVKLGRSRSARLITKSVYTGVSEWVSEWVTHLHIGVPITNFVSTLHVFHLFKNQVIIILQTKKMYYKISKKGWVGLHGTLLPCFCYQQCFYIFVLQISRIGSS